MNFAIFDLDGCVSDDRHRRYRLPLEGAADGCFEAYHEACGNDPVVPAGLSAIRAAEREGLAVAFVTGRPAKYRERTVLWISKRLGIDSPTLLMRPSNDVQASPDLKLYLLRSRGIRPDQIQLAYDDRDDVLHAYAAYGVPGNRLHKLCVTKAPPQQQNPLPLSASTPPEELNDEDPARWLREGEKVFERAGGTYKDAYLVAGEVMAALFPEGVTCETAEDFQRFGVLTQIVGKATRYAMAFDKGGHADSAFDLSVYGSMLRAITKEGVKE